MQNVLLNPTRTGLIDTLIEMGSIDNRRAVGGEEVGDIHVRASRLKGVAVPPARAPSMIDEYPVARGRGGLCRGRYADAGHRRDARQGIGSRRHRARRAARQRRHCRGHAGDAYRPRRVEVEGGGTVSTHLDHRIAMSFLVLGLATEKPVTVDDARTIATSYPDFRSLMTGLGASFADPDDA